jgi:hypothetical protein
MAMHNLNLLPYDDVPKDGEKRKDGRERSFAVNDKKGHVIDFKTVGKISNACPPGIRMGYDDYFVSTVDEFLRMMLALATRSRASPYAGQLIHVAFHPAYFHELDSLLFAKQSLPGWGKKLSLIMLFKSVLIYRFICELLLTQYCTASWQSVMTASCYT